MNTGQWLLDLLTHFFGMLLEILVDGLIGSLFEWYYTTPYAIDYKIITNLWWYVRLISAPLLMIGLIISVIKVYRGNGGGEKLVSSFFIALVVASTSLWIVDYITFASNMITDGLRSPILQEAYHNSDQNNLEIVQEGLSDDEIDFKAFSPLSILKYSFGSDSSNLADFAKPQEESEENKNSSGSYYGIGSYSNYNTVVSETEKEEKLYYVFLLKYGGAGPLACIVGMLEITVMCLFAILRFIVMTILIGFLGLAIAKDTFTGGNEDLFGYVGLIIRTNLISLIFNIGWIGASALSHSKELSIIHPQYWSLLIYGVVLVLTYFFWLKEIINRLIKPSVEKIVMSKNTAVERTKSFKETIGTVSRRLGFKNNNSIAGNFDSGWIGSQNYGFSSSQKNRSSYSGSNYSQNNYLKSFDSKLSTKRLGSPQNTNGSGNRYSNDLGRIVKDISFEDVDFKEVE